MRKTLQILGVGILALLFMAAPLLSSSVSKMGGGVEVHPAVYQYNYRYMRPVYDRDEDSGSTQCYWLYTNGAYVYVCG